MKTCRSKLTTEERSVAQANVQRRIFQAVALSLLLFIIDMMPFTHILAKGIAGYKLSKLQEKINNLMYMDDIKLLTKK